MQASSKYYFPPKVKNVLSDIESYPVTLVEAPSGFGKTTAVREHLKTNTDQEYNEYWYTCFGEPLERSWEGFCSILSKIDDKTGKYINHLGVPCEDTFADIADALRRCEISEETFIVVDNFQYVLNDLSGVIIDVLASHGNAKLHIILLTQPTDSLNQRDHQDENIYHITGDVFIFGEKDTSEYLKKNNISLKPEEFSSVYNTTEGWIAALNLQKQNYEHTGKFDTTVDMGQLIKSVIWNRLDDQEKDFLLSVSIFDHFSIDQARIMSGEDELPEYANKLLDGNSFIRYDTSQKIYIFHALLSAFLKREFEKLSKVKTNRIKKLAGKAYEAVGLNYLALLCFLEIKDYHSLFSLNITGNDFTSYISIGSTETLESLIDQCPQNIMIQYPKRLLVLAFEFYMTGRFDSFFKVSEIIRTIIDNKDEYDISNDDYRIIAGEFALLESFLGFNDIEKMSEKHKEALGFLDSPAVLFDWRDSWTFGQPSVLYLFWSKSGELDRELDLMDQDLPYYYKLTYGHGTGAETLMRAEALFMSGNDKEAEALCHKALYLANGKEQDSICYGAELVLARIALLRGDSESYNTARTNMEKRLLDGTEPGGQRIVDLSQAFLETAMGSTDVKEWISDIEQIRKNLYPIASFYGVLIYLNILLINREYAMVVGLSEPLLEEGRNQNFLLAQVYILIFTAVAKIRQEQEKDAFELLEAALEIAVPDKIYMPFAENGIQLEPLLKQIKDKEGVKEILALTKMQTEGVHAMVSQKSEKPVLTQREREVAELAARELTNDQIAKQLFVSVNTVKVLLKRVFAKLDIKSRAQLPDHI